MRLLRMYRTYAQIPNNISLVRYWLLKPFIFETITMLMQLKDLRRRAKIDRPDIADPWLKKILAIEVAATRRNFTRTRYAEKYYAELTYPYSRVPYIYSGLTDAQIMGKGLENEKLLIIGPRNFHELLLAWLYGYRWKNIYAIDLYSMNPKIKIMDMNAMDFEGEFFDAIVEHHVLVYSQDLRKTLSEISRVLKPSGRFVFGLANTTPPDSFQKVGRVSFHGEEIRQILRELGFFIAAFRVTYVYDPETVTYGTSYFFSVQKTNPKDLGFDAIEW